MSSSLTIRTASITIYYAIIVEITIYYTIIVEIMIYFHEIIPIISFCIKFEKDMIMYISFNDMTGIIMYIMKWYINSI